MEPRNSSGNGAGRVPGAHDLPGAPPPDAVVDLAEGCVRFVEKALGVRLDYQPETLPVLDHYLAQARGAVAARADVLPVVAHAAGAYFGEVVRRRYTSWWRTEGGDPTYWQIELEAVYLAFCPVLLVREALAREAGDPEAEEEPEAGGLAGLLLEEEDRQAIAARLADLPPVSEEEYYALSTRLEVIDIAVEAIRARRMAAGEEADAALEPDDYDRGD